MKKLATFCLALAVGVGSVIAAAPAVRKANPNTAPTGNVISENPYAVPTLRSVKASDALPGVQSAVAQSASVKNLSKKAPAFAGASGSTIYGDLVVYDGPDAWPLGLGEVSLDGEFTPMISFDGIGSGSGEFAMAFGYVYNGHYIGVGQEVMWIFVLGTYKVDVDLATGDKTVTEISAADVTPLYLAVYSAEDDKVYGFTQNQTTGVISFGHLSDPADPTSEFVVTAEPSVDNFPNGKFGVASTLNQVTNQFVVFSETGQVSEVDKTTGKYTKIGEVENPSAFLSGACYSPLDGGYVYAVCTQEACAIQLLDGDTFEVISSEDYAGIVEYDFLYCPDTQVIEESAPAESKFVNAVFPNGALSGTVTYQLASVTHGGTPIIGNIDWILEVDGAEYKRGSAAAGSKVTVEVKDLTEGLHKFTFKASLGGRFGRFLSNTLYIGNDTPVAPEKVELTGTKIVWTPVTKGVNNGYVNAKEVTYNVYLNDELIARGISATETATKLDPEKPLDFYVAAVEAVFDGKRSEKAYSNDIAYGSALELPQVLAPTEKESRLFTIVDNNGAGATGGDIKFGTALLNDQLGEFTGFYYSFDGSKPADDYLFLPLMNFKDANAVYEFSANIFRTDTYMEKYEIVLATAPAVNAIVKTIVPETEAVQLDRETGSQEDGNQEIYFNVPAAGNYVIGIHVTSDADQFRLWMNDFSVKVAEGMAVTGPTTVTDLTAVAADKGALNATVSFTLPTTQINGAAIAADAALTATVQADGCETVNVTGKAGEAKSVVIPTVQGDNVVTVQVSNGALKGIPATTTVYTGIEKPYMPTNFKVTMSEDNYTAHLSWDAPTEGANGGYVAPTGFTYYLCNYVDNGWTAGWQIGEVIGTDVYSYDIEIPEGTAQAFSRYGVIAENLAGMGAYLAVGNAVTGLPYANPTTCNYAAGDNLQPIVTYTTGFTAYLGDPKVRLPQFATDDNRKALYTYATSAVYGGKFSMPKFSTKDCTKGAIELTIWGGSCSSFSVSAATYGVAETTVKTFAKSDFAEEGVQKVVVELPAQFQDKDWVEPFITFDLANRSESFIMYAFRYIDYLPNDFGVLQLTGAKNAKVGEEAQFTAEIMNYGYQNGTEPAGKWTLTREDGTVLADVNVAATSTVVEADGTFSTSISYTPTADDLGKLTLTYTIAEGDNKANNDSKTVEVNVSTGSQPVVTDLHATEITGQNVDLAWTAPVAAGDAEGFEEEAPFEIVDDIAGFTVIDGDEAQLYGINNPAFAALDWAYQPMGFMVWSESGMDEILGTTGGYPAHTGDQFIVAMCPSPDQSTGVVPDADDWLISPEVNGGSTFSFWARAFIYEYGAENIEIMYSTTGNKPEDFKLLENLELDGDAAAKPEWELYEYTLPADAKYFAIHYVSNDIFGIAIDDITYSAAGEAVQIEKYEVYRDGELVGTATDTVFDDATVAEDTQYSYIVVPVLSDGAKGLDSNTLVLRTTGVAGIVLDAQDAEWYNLQGVRVDAGRLEPGVYIRVKGEKAVKVIVK